MNERTRRILLIAGTIVLASVSLLFQRGQGRFKFALMALSSSTLA